MRSPFRVALTAAALALPLLAARAASAGPTGWAAVGGGALGWKQDSSIEPGFNVAGSVLIEAGVGTPSRYPVIVGGIFRITPLLATATGADLAWLLRVCNRGYQVGGFGLAADVGIYARTWGDTPSQGFAGSLSLGAPLGLTASFHVNAGSDNLLAFGGTISVDLLRLTLYRETLLNWWPNPEVNTPQLPTASGPVGFRF